MNTRWFEVKVKRDESKEPSFFVIYQISRRRHRIPSRNLLSHLILQLICVVATVSTFSPMDKAKIKAEVMSLVSKYGIEQITRQAIPTSYQNQWPNKYSGHPSTFHGYTSPSTSKSADSNFRCHTATSEATSYVFSPEPDIPNVEML
ncbi:hypothetical protein JTB14_024532 [Gonioctena quinquepunctata]|nr:hypothetical protein JTB14_024532 [Gonioctena quinquepunctata]